MNTVESLQAAALANTDSTTPGVMLEVGDRLLWVYPCDGIVHWFLDGRGVPECEVEAFLGGYSIDPHRYVDVGG